MLLTDSMPSLEIYVPKSKKKKEKKESRISQNISSKNNIFTFL